MNRAWYRTGECALKSTELQQHAVECARLAQQSADPVVRQYLDELAREFRKWAEAMGEGERRAKGANY
jgi:hypothetical protein